jgi:hypothetical protein
MSFIHPHGIGKLLSCAVKHFIQQSQEDMLIATGGTPDPMQNAFFKGFVA